jgi:hypothetical protein
VKEDSGPCWGYVTGLSYHALGVAPVLALLLPLLAAPQKQGAVIFKGPGDHSWVLNSGDNYPNGGIGPERSLDIAFKVYAEPGPLPDE